MTKICTLFFLICTLAVCAQDRLDKAIELLENNYTQEKIHLLTDKEKYVAGDQIWFKAFAFEGYRKSGISGTLFVELYDRNKKLIDSRTVVLLDGEGHGTIKLKTDLSEDIYYLRAVTPYMNNFTREFDFIKSIPVYNPESANKLESINDNSWTISAVPEGHILIQNSESKVAVRLHSNGNPPEQWHGYLVDTTDPQTKLASLTAMDTNVGFFTFTPKANATYKVHVQDNTGKKQEIDLQPASVSGVSLKVKNVKEGTHYTLTAVNMPQGLMNYKVVGTINNKLAYRANIKKHINELNVTVPSKINDGQAGILQLSVFDANDTPVAHRLVFINPNRARSQSAFIQNLSLNTNPRSRSSISINSAKTPVAIMVKDGGTATVQERHNLLSSLWLTADIKSPIHRPDRYFDSSADNDALDVLLMSEKWSRFNWNALSQGQAPKITGPLHSFLSYEGRLALNSRPLPNQNVTLMSKGADGEIAFTPLTTDKEGKIYLNNVYIDEPLDISFFLEGQTKDQRSPDNLTLNFRMLKPAPFNGKLPTPPYRLVPRPSSELVSAEIAQAITSRNNVDQLFSDAQLIEEVKLVAKKKDLTKKLNNQLSTGMFKTGNSEVFDFVNENQSFGSGNILEWLQGRAAGLQIESRGGVSYPVIRGTPAKIFLDEFPADVNMVATIPMSSIAMVKVVRTGSAVGEAVVIYTKRGNMGSNSPSTRNNRTQLTGYDKPAEPEFINLSPGMQNSIKTDAREVLYWNPQHTGGTAEFLNNDNADAFRIVAVGFDENGNLIYHDQIHKK